MLTANQGRQMTGLETRPMTDADVDAISVLYRSGGWDARRSFLVRFLANSSPASRQRSRSRQDRQGHGAAGKATGSGDARTTRLEADLRNAADDPGAGDRMGAGAHLEPPRIRVRVSR